MPDHSRVRLASPPDIDAILVLEQACAEAPHWSRSVWLAALTAQPEEPTQRACLVIEEYATLLGFAVVSCTGDLAELETVAVAAPARRRGVGRELCQGVMAWSRSAGARQLELEVRASNSAALSLYRGLGFVEQGRRRHYYRDPAEDAVLMAIRLDLEDLGPE